LLSSAFTPSMGIKMGGVRAPGAAFVSIKTPKGEVKIDMKNMEALAKQIQDLAPQMEKNKK
jgi:hypothetical protein